MQSALLINQFQPKYCRWGYRQNNTLNSWRRRQYTRSVQTQRSIHGQTKGHKKLHGSRNQINEKRIIAVSMPFRYLGPPPPQRINWNSLNSSQKRYAITQHNKARARRNLAPFVLGEEAPVENNEQGNDGASDFSSDSDLLWDYDGGINPNNININHMASTEQPSTSTDVATTNTGDGSSAAKKRKTTALPGTGNENAADADTGYPSIENATIPSAPSTTTGYRMVFRKHHTLVSYGVANIQLQLASSSHDRIGTTNLMYLPVDKPYFYLSPSEFFKIVCSIRGVRVIETKCKVVLRNPRTAFETNASTSNLATLNQNKFIQMSMGLINKTRGLNLLYKFNTPTNPMKPTSVETISEDIQSKFICAAYGVTDAFAINFSDGNTMPCSFFNLPMQFPVYYSLYTNSNHNKGELGWQDINKFIDKKDASNLIGKTVIDYSYKPTMGLLTLPWGYVYTGRCDQNPDKKNDFSVYTLGRTMEPGCTVKSMEVGKHAPLDMDVSAITATDWKRMFPKEKNRYFKPIECSQYITKQNVRMKGTLQPSLHVGVCPVPQLTTTSASLVPDKFTDVEGTFDVDTEIVLEFGIPFDHTHFSEPHVSAENHLEGLYGLSADNMYREDLSVFDNQYIVSKET